MRKGILPIILLLALIFTGCSGGKASTTTTTKPDSTRSVKEYLEAHVMSETVPMLEDEWLTITPGADGKVNITIRAVAPYFIPYAADTIIPTAQEAIKENGAELGIFTVNSYAKNNSGIVKGTMADWHTSDWERGTFTSEADGNKIIPGATLKDIYEYYADYDELVQKILAGEYDR
ncbi:hypothetical protein EI53_01220 [Fusobacterium naviforme]|nr:hypothetical protein F7P78_06105 [Fusobacterium naviforme]PSL10158.1 hypothetical protein EI53_01220 [Fusobacterium naviforme]STO27568.1 Uncharacterised protein [Fusobacterium naviforme]